MSRTSHSGDLLDRLLLIRGVCLAQSFTFFIIRAYPNNQKTTTSEVVARLHGDWAADIAAYDNVHTQILKMADMLTNGIVNQFLAKFK
jgi:hypothetical protein